MIVFKIIYIYFFRTKWLFDFMLELKVILIIKRTFFRRLGNLLTLVQQFQMFLQTLIHCRNRNLANILQIIGYLPFFADFGIYWRYLPFDGNLSTLKAIFVFEKFWNRFFKTIIENYMIYIFTCSKPSVNGTKLTTV